MQFLQLLPFVLRADELLSFCELLPAGEQLPARAVLPYKCLASRTGEGAGTAEGAAAASSREVGFGSLGWIDVQRSSRKWGALRWGGEDVGAAAQLPPQRHLCAERRDGLLEHRLHRRPHEHDDREHAQHCAEGRYHAQQGRNDHAEHVVPVLREISPRQ